MIGPKRLPPQLPLPFRPRAACAHLLVFLLAGTGTLNLPQLAAAGSNPPVDTRLPTSLQESIDSGLVPYRTLMDEAITLYEQKRYHKASTALFDYLDKPVPAILSAEARYRLGRSLEVVNQPMMAMLMYRDVTRFGPMVGQVYTEALSAWIQLALKFDDTVDLGHRIRQLPAEKDPAGADVLKWLRGLELYERGELESSLAILTGLADANTVIGRQASYTAAMALIKQNKRPLAIKLLDPLTSGMPRGSQDVMTAKELLQVERLRELATIALARIAYSERRFADARTLYARIGSKSPYQPRVQYEQAWMAFWTERGADVLPALAKLRLDRQQGEGAFVPEAELLAAMFYLRTNQHDLADGVLRTYLERLHTLRLALRDFDRAYHSDDDMLALVQRVTGLKPEIPLEGEASAGDARDPSLEAAAEKALPVLKPILEDIGRHRDITRSISRVEQLRSDYQGWSRQISWWKGASLGVYVGHELGLEERRTLIVAGRTYMSELLSQRLLLSEQNVVALTLRREVTMMRLALAKGAADPDPYRGAPLPPFDFVRPSP